MEGFAVSPLRNVPLALQSVRRTVLPTDSLWQLIFLRSVFSSYPPVSDPYSSDFERKNRIAPALDDRYHQIHKEDEYRCFRR